MIYIFFLIVNIAFSQSSLQKHVEYCSSNTLSLKAYEVCMESRISFNKIQSCRKKSKSSDVFIACIQIAERRNLQTSAIDSCANTTLWNKRFKECLNNIN